MTDQFWVRRYSMPSEEMTSPISTCIDIRQVSFVGWRCQLSSTSELIVEMRAFFWMISYSDWKKNFNHEPTLWRKCDSNESMTHSYRRACICKCDRIVCWCVAFVYCILFVEWKRSGELSGSDGDGDFGRTLVDTNVNICRFVASFSFVFYVFVLFAKTSA